MKYIYTKENSREEYWKRKVTSFYNSCKDICQYLLRNKEKEPDPMWDNPSQEAKTEYKVALEKFRADLLKHTGKYI